MMQASTSHEDLSPRAEDEKSLLTAPSGEMDSTVDILEESVHDDGPDCITRDDPERQRKKGESALPSPESPPCMTWVQKIAFGLPQFNCNFGNALLNVRSRVALFSVFFVLFFFVFCFLNFANGDHFLMPVLAHLLLHPTWCLAL